MQDRDVLDPSDARTVEAADLSWVATLPLEGESEPGRVVRTFLRLQLQMDGIGDLADEVEAVASELLRDAVQRGAVPSHLVLDVRPRDVVVVLRDRGGPTPTLASELVSRDLAGDVAACVAPADWGWRDLQDGREVWFSLNRRPRSAVAVALG